MGSSVVYERVVFVAANVSVKLSFGNIASNKHLDFFQKFLTFFKNFCIRVDTLFLAAVFRVSVIFLKQIWKVRCTAYAAKRPKC